MWKNTQVDTQDNTQDDFRCISVDDKILDFCCEPKNIEEIKNTLDYPVSIDKIHAVISDYKKKKNSGDSDAGVLVCFAKTGRKP